MTTLIGTIVQDEEGTLCIKMRLTPQNPEEYEIPIEEVLEDFIGKKVKIDILPIKTMEEVFQ